MWRNETGLVEMLFTYINEFNEFESYSNWRLVLVDILASHEETRRQRAEFAGEYVNKMLVKNEIVMEEPLEAMQEHSTHEESGRLLQNAIEDIQQRLDNDFEAELPGDMDRSLLSTRPAFDQIDLTNEDCEESVTNPLLQQSSTNTLYKDISTGNDIEVVRIDPETVETTATHDISSNETSSTYQYPVKLESLDQSACIEHLQQSIPRPLNRSHRCKVCGLSFLQISLLRIHMRLHYPIRSFQSNFDKTSFQNSEPRVQRHNRSIESKFKCYSSEKYFHQYSDLDRHVKSKHNNGRGLFSCNLCEKSFIHKHDLNRHVKMVHCIERPYLCQVCGKSFTLRWCLKRHMITHSRGSNA